MAAHVNLDALVPRKDFEVESTGAGAPLKQEIQIRDLEPDAFFYGALRKPDFQRETAEWDPQRVVGLIRGAVGTDDGHLLLCDGAVALDHHGEHLGLDARVVLPPGTPAAARLWVRTAIRCRWRRSAPASTAPRSSSSRLLRRSRKRSWRRPTSAASR